MLGDDLSGNKDSPTTSGSAGRSNSLDLSSKAIGKFRSAFKSGGLSKATPVGKIVEVVDETTGREVLHSTIFGPSEIQTRDCPSVICP